MAKPLHRLTEKGVMITWTSECTQIFHALKTQIISAPILALPDWSKPFVLETGIGTVLFQLGEDGSESVVAYASRVLSKQERNYCVIQKEMLAVVTFLQHFKQYLIGVTLHHLHIAQRTNLVAELQATRRTAGTLVGETAGVSVYNCSLPW